MLSRDSWTAFKPKKPLASIRDCAIKKRLSFFYALGDHIQNDTAGVTENMKSHSDNILNPKNTEIERSTFYYQTKKGLPLYYNYIEDNLSEGIISM